MAVSETFRSLVLDQLARLAPAVTGKRMFGGLGIYSGRSFFAIAADDRLYLKADDQTRGDFVAQGWEPFRPHGDDGVTIQYYEAPLETIENVDRLAPWVERALAAASRSKRPTRRAAPRTKPKAAASSRSAAAGTRRASPRGRK